MPKFWFLRLADLLLPSPLMSTWHTGIIADTVNTTVPVKEHKKYSYKLRGLDITQANQVWSTDITYVKINGGMVYLAVIIDWHSKAVLSHKISNTMDSALVMDVLEQALSHYGTPEIFNTDQGSQYTSEIHTQRLKNKGITISMDGIGRATDNICIERFWRSAKCERLYLNEYDSIGGLQEDIDDYIEFYNHRRFHETLDYKKPGGVAIFAKACFGHPSPSKRQKLNATTNAFGAPDVLRTCHFATIIVNSMLAS